MSPDAADKRRSRSNKAEETVQYPYKPLETLSSTMICVLQPGRKRDKIQCSLSEVNLDTDVVDFVALSYTWDDPAMVKHVRCEGYLIPITASLFSALKRLRAMRHQRVWVDALCINQSNEKDALVERAQQVQLMHRIYSRALKVVVYLGEEDCYTHNAITFIEELHEWMPRLSQERTNRFPTFDLPLTVKNKLPDWRVLMNRQWLRRIWVVEEYALAKDVEMIIGNKTIDQEALCDTASYMRGKNPFAIYEDKHHDQARMIKGALQGADNLAMMHWFREETAKQNSHTLARLMTVLREFDSTDPRDKVYALLGMASDGHRMPVDYEAPVRDIYHAAALLCYRIGFTFLMLSHAGWTTQLPEAPSWVPDFSRQYVQGSRLQGSPIPFFHAASSRASEVSLNISRDHLHISGILFDKISEVSDKFPDPNQHSDDPRNGVLASLLSNLQLERWFTQAAELAKRDIVKQKIGEDTSSTLYRTLVGAKFNGSRDLSDASGYPKAFQDFCFWRNLIIYRLTLLKYDKSSRVIRGGSKQWNNKVTAALTEPCKAFLASMMDSVMEKRLCVTRSGGLGLVPFCAEPGDEIVLFCGDGVPHVLRRHKKRPTYHYVGNCYIDGIMDGEVFEHGEPEIVGFDLA